MLSSLDKAVDDLWLHKSETQEAYIMKNKFRVEDAIEKRICAALGKDPDLSIELLTESPHLVKALIHARAFEVPGIFVKALVRTLGLRPSDFPKNASPRETDKPLSCGRVQAISRRVEIDDEEMRRMLIHTIKVYNRVHGTSD